MKCKVCGKDVDGVMNMVKHMRENKCNSDKLENLTTPQFIKVLELIEKENRLSNK